MNRRQLVSALGVLATGGAVTAGTGAFTSVTTERTTTVTATGETQAYLAMKPVPTTESDNDVYAEQAGADTIKLDFNGVAGSDGTGVSKDTTYEFDKVFRITNKSPHTVYVQIDDVELPATKKSDNSRVEFYSSSNSAKKRIDGTSAEVELSSGASDDIGVRVVTTGNTEMSGSSAFNKTTTVRAQTNQFTSDGTVITP